MFGVNFFHVLYLNNLNTYFKDFNPNLDYAKLNFYCVWITPFFIECILPNTHSNVFKIAGVNRALIEDGDECNHKPLQNNNKYASVTLPPSKSRFPPLSGNLIKYPSQDALQTFDGTNELLLGRNIQVIFPWHKQSDILSFKLLKLNLF